MKVNRFGSAAALLAVALAAAACGSSSSSSGTSGSTGSAASGGTGTTYQSTLDTLYKGELGTPPTTPAKAKAGVSVWVISCGQQVPSCVTPTQAAVSAAKLVGWTTHVCDGQLNPNGWGTCVRQATSAKATVILPVGIDCASIKQPFQEAKAAGVTVVGAGGADCDATGGTKLWATERLQLKDTTIKQYWELSGKMRADWLIAKTGGKASVLLLNFTDPIWGPWITEGFTTELATCSGCSVAKQLDLSNNDFVSNQANTKFATALLQVPNANAVAVPVDGWLIGGFAQAIVSSGRASKLEVCGGFGDTANLALIRTGKGQNCAVGYAPAWGAWGSIDEAIRVLNGQQPEVEGDGLQVIDADHNLPAAGQAYQPPVDFETAYKKAWGVS
ncbi:MAG TPA: substrate-binding domain-containing protein [Rugosimonospora sp.]|nr:substrate-binding domain-containing protein [Rugosimonospora sp.]